MYQSFQPPKNQKRKTRQMFFRGRNGSVEVKYPDNKNKALLVLAETRKHAKLYSRRMYIFPLGD